MQKKQKKQHDDFEVRIKIVQSAIALYGNEIDRLGADDSPYLKQVRSVYIGKLKSEQETLEQYKISHPEYFI